jgi:hypothetical protein
LRFLYAVRFTGFTTTVWSRTALMPLLSLDPRQSFAVVGGCAKFCSKSKIHNPIRRFVRQRTFAKGEIKMHFMLTKCIKALTNCLSLHTRAHVSQFTGSLVPLADSEHRLRISILHLCFVLLVLAEK